MSGSTATVLLRSGLTEVQHGQLEDFVRQASGSENLRSFWLLGRPFTISMSLPDEEEPPPAGPDWATPREIHVICHARGQSGDVVRCPRARELELSTRCGLSMLTGSEPDSGHWICCRNLHHIRQKDYMALTLEAARLLRDGCIDAAAALNEALSDALKALPADDRSAWAQATGRAMAEVFEHVLNPVIAEFPELEVDEAAWVGIARDQAAKRAAPK